VRMPISTSWPSKPCGFSPAAVRSQLSDPKPTTLSSRAWSRRDQHPLASSIAQQASFLSVEFLIGQDARVTELSELGEFGGDPRP
jgi:hypothetical protein